MAGMTVLQRMRGSALGTILSRKKLEELAVVWESPDPRRCLGCGRELPVWATSCASCGLACEPVAAVVADEQEPAAVAASALYRELVDQDRVVIQRVEQTRAHPTWPPS